MAYQLVLYQDLVQVKMRFSPIFNRPSAIRAVVLYDKVLHNHLVTYSRSDYESVLYCRMPPDTRILIDMHAHNRGF